MNLKELLNVETDVTFLLGGIETEEHTLTLCAPNGADMTDVRRQIQKLGRVAAMEAKAGEAEGSAPADELFDEWDYLNARILKLCVLPEQGEGMSEADWLQFYYLSGAATGKLMIAAYKMCGLNTEMMTAQHDPIPFGSRDPAV